MIVSLEWLKDYTEVKVSPEEFCDRMIMSGSNLETMENVGVDMEKVVVGRIEKIENEINSYSINVAKNILNNINGISIVRFHDSDVMRHPLVFKIVNRYNRLYEEKNEN